MEVGETEIHTWSNNENRRKVKQPPIMRAIYMRARSKKTNSTEITGRKH